MPAPWEKYQSTDKAEAAGPWSKYKTEAPARIKNTELESTARGVAHGALSGFSDEGEGVLRTGKQVLTGEIKPQSLSDLVTAYRSNRDIARGKNEQALEDNPISYTGGEVLGGVGSAFVPGLNFAKGATLAAKLGTAAKAGALAGLGTSTADLTKGEISDAATDTAAGAAIGTAVQGGLSGLGAAVKSLTPTNVARKLSNVFLNTPEEITDTYIKNPQGVINAPRRFEVAEKYQGLLGDLKGEVQQGSKASRDILRDEANIVKGSEIANIYNQKAEQLAKRSEGVWDEQQLAAYNWLKDKASQYAPTKGEGAIIDRKLSTNRVKDALQAIDQSTEFETKAGKFAKIDDRIKTEIRHDIDQLLKGRSPAYTDQMKEVASDTRLLGDASDIAKTPQGLANVFRRLQTDEYGGGQVPRKTLEAFDQRMGSDILEQAKLSTAREAFDKSVTNGSRNVQFFKGLLENIPYIGKPLGAIAGGTVDKYGRQMTMAAVEAAGGLNEIYQREGIQQFIAKSKPIRDAALKGNPAAIATFQILSQSNPQAIEALETQNAMQRRLQN